MNALIETAEIANTANAAASRLADLVQAGARACAPVGDEPVGVFASAPASSASSSAPVSASVSEAAPGADATSIPASVNANAGTNANTDSGAFTVPDGWQSTEGTLAREVRIDGHGLHTGQRVHVRIEPASSGGIVFRRVERGRAGRDGRVLGTLAVDPALRRAQPLCTMLRDDAQGFSVRTTEHLLASFIACEIDHALVELDAEEVPILDGSAKLWVEAFQASGRAPLPSPKRFIRVLKPVSVEGEHGGERSEMRVEPASRYELDITTTQKGYTGLHWQGALTPAVFAGEIALSRSYGPLLGAVLAMGIGYVLRQPLLRGARTSCAATFIGRHVLGGLRVPDEFVRHRVLDLVGDLAMARAPLLGRVTAFRSSHEMNYRLLNALLSTPDAWEWATASQIREKS